VQTTCVRQEQSSKGNTTQLIKGFLVKETAEASKSFQEELKLLF